jgi:hypothetical protein
MQDLESTAWVVYYATPGREDDAAFIAKQILELKQFIAEHQEHLGTVMMPPTAISLLSSLTSDDIFHSTLFPMLKAKATRDGCTVEAVFRELSRWVGSTVETTGQTVEDLVLEVCARQSEEHEAYLAANKNSGGKKKARVQSKTEMYRDTQHSSL